MTTVFDEIETTQERLWDFGWFTVTRFHVTLPTEIRSSADMVLDQFIHNSIYRRSFCESPDPWAANIDRHGPFLINAIKNEWYRRVNPPGLAAEIEAVMNDDTFDGPPTIEQQRPVKNWISKLADQRYTIFTMDAPDGDDLRVEWFRIWFVFREFIAITEKLNELEVAVIGYD